MRSVRLIKLSDDRYKGEHPNGINEGHVKKGILIQKPVVGISCIVNSFYTSQVTEIIDECTFKTLNSTYRLIFLDELDDSLKPRITK